METIQVLFGQAVRRRREQLKISQEEFAAKAGIHRTYVSSIELGKVGISIGIAWQLAEALELPVSKLWAQVENHRNKAANLPLPGNQKGGRTFRKN